MKKITANGGVAEAAVSLVLVFVWFSLLQGEPKLQKLHAAGLNQVKSAEKYELKRG